MYSELLDKYSPALKSLFPHGKYFIVSNSRCRNNKLSNFLFLSPLPSRPCRRHDSAGVHRGDRSGGEPLSRHLQMGRRQPGGWRGRHRGGSRRLHLEPVVRRHSAQAGKTACPKLAYSVPNVLEKQNMQETVMRIIIK